MDYSAGTLDRPENVLSNRIDRAPRAQRVARAQVNLSCSFHAFSSKFVPAASSLQASQAKKKVKKRKLVFLQSSPDYCRSVGLPTNIDHSQYDRENTTAGYQGVVGRTCQTDPNRYSTIIYHLQIQMLPCQPGPAVLPTPVHLTVQGVWALCA